MLSNSGSGRALGAVILIWIATSSVQAETITSCVASLNSCSLDQLLQQGKFGYPTASQTYGQTITAPLTDDLLSSFSFEMMLPTTVQLRGYVYEWDGTKAKAEDNNMGLFVSDPVHTTDPNSFQTITFDTSGMKPLTAGGSYVLFVSTVDGGSGSGNLGRPKPLQPDESLDFYSGGQFVFLNGVDWTTLPWVPNRNESNPLGIGGDLAFSATFISGAGSVPEPGSLPLITGAAIAALAVALRKRHK